MEWLAPWNPAEAVGERLTQGLMRQLEVELPPGHVLYGVPVKVLARGNGDVVLFELLDGSGRVADVHLTWSKGRERRKSWGLSTKSGQAELLSLLPNPTLQRTASPPAELYR